MQVCPLGGGEGGVQQEGAACAKRSAHHTRLPRPRQTRHSDPCPATPPADPLSPRGSLTQPLQGTARQQPLCPVLGPPET